MSFSSIITSTTMILVIFLAGSCTNNQDLTIFAASSLTDVMPTLTKAHRESETNESTLVVGGSNHLAAQLRDGAPADVFVTANFSLLSDLNFLNEPVSIAKNHLVVAVPINNPGNLKSFDDLYRSELKLAICSEVVPCGDATIRRFGYLPADTREPSVRAVLSRLTLDEVDVGIVYATDVIAEKKVSALGHQPPVCPCVTYTAVAFTDRGSNFVDFLTDLTALNIFLDHGFRLP
tara:strand:- start:219 stop:920 length:702 start_codon:yes stop_codon:yes gene_type:complete